MSLTPMVVSMLVLAFALGASIGSFLNVVAYRLPNRMSVVSPPSQCPGCGHRIAWYDNVPVLSWLALRGRCRRCAARISVQYVMVETGFGLFALAIASSMLLRAPSRLVLSAETSVAVVVTLLGALGPAIAGVRRERRDAAQVRLIAASEAEPQHDTAGTGSVLEANEKAFGA